MDLADVVSEVGITFPVNGSVKQTVPSGVVDSRSVPMEPTLPLETVNVGKRHA